VHAAGEVTPEGVRPLGQCRRVRLGGHLAAMLVGILLLLMAWGGSDAAAKEPAPPQKGKIYGGELNNRARKALLRNGILKGWPHAVQFRITRDGRWATDFRLSINGGCGGVDAYVEIDFEDLKLRITQRGRRYILDPGRSLYRGYDGSVPPPIGFDATFAALFQHPPPLKLEDYKGWLHGAHIEFWKGPDGQFFATGLMAFGWYLEQPYPPFGANCIAAASGLNDAPFKAVAGQRMRLRVKGLREAAVPPPVLPSARRR
jgi:hypothetical protein